MLRTLPGAPPLTVIPGFFDLTFSRNTGGVFGLGAGDPSLGRRAFFVVSTASGFISDRLGAKGPLLFGNLMTLTGERVLPVRIAPDAVAGRIADVGNLALPGEDREVP